MFHTVHNPYRHRKGGVRTEHDSLLEETRRRTRRVPAGVLAALPAVESHRTGRKVSTGSRRHDMEEAHHRRGYVTVAAAVGGGQSRGEAVWGRRTQRSGARKSKGYKATRDLQLTRSHRLLQRLQHRYKDSGACRDSQLRASAHAASGHLLWHKIR